MPVAGGGSVWLGDTARMRMPLTALTVLAPLAILAEIYRFVCERRGLLLVEAHWQPLAGDVGLVKPLLPMFVLVVGCLGVQFVRRLPWRLPGGVVLVHILCWSAIWALVRYALSITHLQLTNGLQVADGSFSKIELLAQLGLVFSGALQEELVFRGVLLGGLLWCVRLCARQQAWLIWLVALPLSALAFALYHTELIHAAGDPLTLPVVTVHGIGGLLYGLVFLRQGLAVAVLAHFGYNVLVMVAAVG